MTLRIHTVGPASDELKAAVRWYESQRLGLGSDFFESVVDTLKRIETYPEAGSSAFGDPDIRRVVVTGFPYQVIYRFRPNELIILAFAHLKRRPGFWKDRKSF